MQYGKEDNIRPAFNDIRIDLRSNGVNNSNENDRRSQGSVPSRISRYSDKIKFEYKFINLILFEKDILKFDRQIHYMQVIQQYEHKV